MNHSILFDTPQLRLSAPSDIMSVCQETRAQIVIGTFSGLCCCYA
jgi:hypothetical protein